MYIIPPINDLNGMNIMTHNIATAILNNTDCVLFGKVAQISVKDWQNPDLTAKEAAEYVLKLFLGASVYDELVDVIQPQYSNDFYVILGKYVPLNEFDWSVETLIDLEHNINKMCYALTQLDIQLYDQNDSRGMIDAIRHIANGLRQAQTLFYFNDAQSKTFLDDMHLNALVFGGFSIPDFVHGAFPTDLKNRLFEHYNSTNDLVSAIVKAFEPIVGRQFVLVHNAHSDKPETGVSDAYLTLKFGQVNENKIGSTITLDNIKSQYDINQQVITKLIDTSKKIDELSFENDLIREMVSALLSQVVRNQNS